MSASWVCLTEWVRIGRLYAMAYAMFLAHDLIKKFNIDEKKLACFLKVRARCCVISFVLCAVHCVLCAALTRRSWRASSRCGPVVVCSLVCCALYVVCCVLRCVLCCGVLPQGAGPLLCDLFCAVRCTCALTGRSWRASSRCGPVVVCSLVCCALYVVCCVLRCVLCCGVLQAAHRRCDVALYCA